MEFSTVIVFIKDLVATIMTLLMMMSPAFGGTGVPYAAEKPEELVMSFTAVSDTHVETNNPKSYTAFYNLLEGIKAGEDNDAVVFLGDNVMNGQVPENIFFYAGVRSVLTEGNNFVVVGNHDLGNGEGDYKKFRDNYLLNNALFLGNKLDKTYYYKVVNGCYMIFLSSEDLSVNECVMSEEQLVWLEGVLNEAAEVGAPTFVFNHHPLYQLTGVAYDSLAKLLSKYDNLLYIYGHTHNEIGVDNFREEGGVKVINLPRSTETVDYAPGGGIVVEVYENEILVRGRDLVEGEWIEGLRYTY